MRFEVIARDATARIGVIEIEGKKEETPCMLWYSSERISTPPFASLFLSEEKAISSSGSIFVPRKKKILSIPTSFVYPYTLPDELHEISGEWNKEKASFFQIVDAKAINKITLDSSIYVLANAREIFSKPREFVRSIINIRKKIGYQKALYAPGLAEPSNIAILSYLTIDIFDSISLIKKARKRIFLFPEGEYNFDEKTCHCPACIERKDFERVLFHNYYALHDELQKVKNVIREKKLREFVEKRVCNMPHLHSILTILDNEYYAFQEKKYAVAGKKINVSCHSLKRPDVERFRKRVQERYKKPESARILLLLPCSAKKPYSFSKSHMLFRKVIKACKNPYIIHEVIVTSPLGIVPRELEMFYPAAHYDISVTGHWSNDEKEMVKKCLFSFLNKNKYDLIINHLPPEITEFIEIGEKTCVDRPTSSPSLSMLSKKLGGVKGDIVRSSQRKYENAFSMLSYQFGEKEAYAIMKGCKIKGRYPYYKIFYGEKQVAMISERGLFSLTMEGAKRLASANSYIVKIDDFVPRGTVFAVGINQADEKIRVGDEVVVCHEDDIRGVGVAMMDGEEMVKSNKGKAVKIRHYKS